ncbi:MAG: hypothetical protein JWM33_2017 [Caulobacteraceae bacterium]|nr:hypothetical protein [Caulobacteraceae bacterium]
MNPEDQLEGFVARFAEATASTARAALAHMRQRLPGVTTLVYDNYNALAIALGPGEKASEIIFSLAVYPRWVSLFFALGVDLTDPHRLLKGTGSRVRHIVLTNLTLLDDPRVDALIQEALSAAVRPIDSSQPHRTVIKSVSARQRPRR